MDSHRLKTLVPRLAGRRVLVIGDVMADHYVWGRVTRISPEAPIPIVHVNEETWRLGGAANVAVNLAALGAKVSLAGVVGRDAMAGKVRELLAQKGIDPNYLVEDPTRPTIQKTRVMAQHQQVVRVDREKATWLSASVREELLAKAALAAQDAQALLFSDYAKGVLTQPVVSALMGHAQARGVITACDPKPANINLFRGASIITPNQAEAQSASGIAIDSDAKADEAGARLLHDLACGCVLITRGEHGMGLYERGQPPAHILTRAREVYDVTGAGDTVIATLTLALAAGASPLEAAHLANAAAGLVVGEIGVAAVTPSELEAAL